MVLSDGETEKRAEKNIGKETMYDLKHYFVTRKLTMQREFTVSISQKNFKHNDRMSVYGTRNTAVGFSFLRVIARANLIPFP